MTDGTRSTHAETLKKLFRALDNRIMGLRGQSVMKGFWQSGSAPVNVASDGDASTDATREMGFWRVSVATAYGPLDIMAAVLGGNVRIGVAVPISFTDKEPTSADFISRLYDGKSAHIERRMGATLLYDWVFSDDPFSAQWLLKCVDDANAYAILENHFLWLVVHFLEGAYRTIVACVGDETPIIADRYVTPELAESFGLTIISCFEMELHDEKRSVTIVRSDMGRVEDDKLQEITEKLKNK